MGRILVFLMFLAVVASVVYGMTLLARVAIRRSRQRKLAKNAPQLLRYEEGTDPEVVRLLVAQRTALEIGVNTVSQMLQDPVMLIPSMYADPLQAWVDTTRKELS